MSNAIPAFYCKACDAIVFQPFRHDKKDGCNLPLRRVMVDRDKLEIVQWRTRIVPPTRESVFQQLQAENIIPFTRVSDYDSFGSVHIVKRKFKPTQHYHVKAKMNKRWLISPLELDYQAVQRAIKLFPHTRMVICKGECKRKQSAILRKKISYPVFKAGLIPKRALELCPGLKNMKRKVVFTNFPLTSNCELRGSLCKCQFPPTQVIPKQEKTEIIANGPYCELFEPFDFNQYLPVKDHVTA